MDINIQMCVSPGTILSTTTRYNRTQNDLESVNAKSTFIRTHTHIDGMVYIQSKQQLSLALRLIRLYRVLYLCVDFILWRSLSSSFLYFEFGWQLADFIFSSLSIQRVCLSVSLYICICIFNPYLSDSHLLILLLCALALSTPNNTKRSLFGC